MVDILRVDGHSLISEVDRKNLVGKTKVQSPARYNRRLNYNAGAKSSNVDNRKFIRNDMAVINVPVGRYICTIAFRGVIHKLIDVVEKQPTGNITLQSVIKAVSRAVDETDVLVDCTCPDWKYRFAYYATKHHYKYGRPETRPSRITNPNDNIGSMCKHLTSILANKQWMIKLSSIINQMVKENYDEIIKLYKLDPEEFFINTPGRPSSKTNRNVSMLKKPEPYSTNDVSSIENDEEEEELEVNLDGSQEEVDDGDIN